MPRPGGCMDTEIHSTHGWTYILRMDVDTCVILLYNQKIPEILLRSSFCKKLINLCKSLFCLFRQFA
jgi:hypothetical protein